MTHDPRDVEAARRAVEEIYGPRGFDPDNLDLIDEETILAARYAREAAEVAQGTREDPDLIAAREAAREYAENADWPKKDLERITKGEFDRGPYVQLPLLTIKAGRRLEKEGRT